MKVLLFIISITILGINHAQKIENIDYFLEGKNIVITYDFENCLTLDKYDVSVVFKEQNGTTINPKSLSGDLKSITCGSKRIVWDALKDVISIEGNWSVELNFSKISIVPTTFKKVTIGTQVWMTENLNVDHFRNGDPIPEAKTAKEWEKAGDKKQPVWCYYDNDPANGKKYGKLYNWYAVNDSRGLAPKGWHIPSDEEWTQLIGFLGEENGVEKKMKSTSGWSNNGNGTNSSGFSGLPGGYCNANGSFPFIGLNGYWWSSTQLNTKNAWYRVLYYYDDFDCRDDIDKCRGLSVRCLSD